jgi:hypothetical protein
MGQNYKPIQDIIYNKFMYLNNIILVKIRGKKVQTQIDELMCYFNIFILLCEI